MKNICITFPIYSVIFLGFEMLLKMIQAENPTKNPESRGYLAPTILIEKYPLEKPDPDQTYE